MNGYTPYNHHAPGASISWEQELLRQPFRPGYSDGLSAQEREWMKQPFRPASPRLSPAAAPRQLRQEALERAFRKAARALGRASPYVKALDTAMDVWQTIEWASNLLGAPTTQAPNYNLTDRRYRESADFKHPDHKTLWKPSGSYNTGLTTEPGFAVPTTLWVNLNPPPSGQGWLPGESGTIPPGRWGFFTTEVRKRTASGLDRYARAGWLIKNTTLVTQPIGIGRPAITTTPEVINDEAEKTNRKRRKRRRKIRLVRHKSILVALTPGSAPRVEVRPNPQERGPGDTGKYKYRDPYTREGKLVAVGHWTVPVLKVLSSVYETVDDLKDWWDIVVAALGLSHLTFEEQVKALADPARWRDLDAELLVKGFVEWWGQEMLYGKHLGSLEEKIAARFDYKLHWGVGNANYGLAPDDPVSALVNWLFSD